MKKKKRNPVNKLLSIIFWLIGWATSYTIIYYSGHFNGSQDAIDAIHYHCFKGNNLQFGEDKNEYICVKSTKM